MALDRRKGFRTGDLETPVISGQWWLGGRLPSPGTWGWGGGGACAEDGLSGAWVSHCAACGGLCSTGLGPGVGLRERSACRIMGRVARPSTWTERGLGLAPSAISTKAGEPWRTRCQ